MAYPPEPRAAPVDADDPATGAARLSGAITLQDVTFGYNPNAPPLIEGFNLDIRPGQRIALVGGSGSGKSTLGRLICGLYPAWSGEVRFDGRPLAAVAPAVLANSLAYVDQDVFLFAGTVRENISLWDDSVDETQLARALHDAAIFEEISQRPGLYDHKMTEDGLNFSGASGVSFDHVTADANQNSGAIFSVDGPVNVSDSSFSDAVNGAGLDFSTATDVTFDGVTADDNQNTSAEFSLSGMLKSE